MIISDRTKTFSFVWFSGETPCWFLKALGGCLVSSVLQSLSRPAADSVVFRSESVWAYRAVYFRGVPVFIFVQSFDSACVVVGPAQRRENGSLTRPYGDTYFVFHCFQTLFYIYIIYIYHFYFLWEISLRMIQTLNNYKCWQFMSKVCALLYQSGFLIALLYLSLRSDIHRHSEKSVIHQWFTISYNSQSMFCPPKHYLPNPRGPCAPPPCCAVESREIL